MTQEELLVSPETFEVLQRLIRESITNNPLSTGYLDKNVEKEIFLGIQQGSHQLIIKKKQSLKKGQWYIHTEPGQEKMIFVVVDPEKQLFSGWDCKGKFFSKEWLFVGDRFKKITESESVIKTHTLGYKVDLLMDDLKSISDETNKI